MSSLPRAGVLLLGSLLIAGSGSGADMFTWQNPLPLRYSSQGAERTELRDPCIIRDEGTYCLVFTMWPFRGRDERCLADPDNGSSPGIALYSSPDLKAWRFESWLVKSSDLPADCPCKHRFWAPETHRINGKSYLIFTADNWLKKEYNPAGSWGTAGYAFASVAEKVTGPYEHVTYIPGAPCDTSLFGDRDGRTYAAMPHYNIGVQEIDLSRIEQDIVQLVGQETQAVACQSDDIAFKVSPEYLEGPWMERVGNRYVLFYAELFKDQRAPGYWTGVAYADAPLGPWHKDPRGQVFEGGHLSVFDGPDGGKWLCYRVEHEARTRGLLAVDPIHLDANGAVQTNGPTTGIQTVPLAPPGNGADFDLQGFIDKAIAAGAKTVVVPPGRYRVTPVDRQHLVLRDLQDVTIIAEGVEMICTETTRALTISNCRNVTVRGLIIDYDPLPFTQGRITALSPDKKVHEVELLDGYPRADAARNFKYEIFASETRTLRCGDHYPSRVEAIDSSHIRIVNSNGADDPEQVGDTIAIGADYAPHGSIPHAVECAGSVNVRLESIELFASNCFGFLEYDCDGSTYYRCRIDRRSAANDPVKRAEPRIRSLDADAFHSKHAVKGPAYIECVARFMGDDAINICGDYHMVTACNGAALRVLAKGGMNIAVGDPCELFAYDGRRLPDARAVRIEADGKINDAEKAFLLQQRMDEGLRTRWNADAYRVTMDREVSLPMGSLIASARRMGNGFLVQGCDFGHSRSRGILVKASDGKVIGNRLTENWGAAILVAPEYWWLESGSSNNVEIRGNTISGCRVTPIQVTAVGGDGLVTGRPAPAGAHSHIAIVGNTISDCPVPCIHVTSTDGLRVDGNTCRLSTGAKQGAAQSEALRIANCAHVTLNGVALPEPRGADPNDPGHR